MLEFRTNRNNFSTKKQKTTQVKCQKESENDMELHSVKHKGFRQSALDVLKKLNFLLVLVRYPYAAGNNDFFLFKSEVEFDTFLSIRKPKESITIFKELNIVKFGLVNGDFKQKIIAKAKIKISFNWLIINSNSRLLEPDWCFIANLDELTEEIIEFENEQVYVLIEPDWFDEAIIVHGYIPDEDGIIRPGSY